MQRVLLDNLLEDFMGVNFGLHLPTIQFLPLCCLLIRIKSDPQIGTTISTPYFDDLTNILIN